jgi:hypothetical protein
MQILSNESRANNTRSAERNVFVLTDHIPQPPETIELLKARSAPTDPN